MMLDAMNAASYLIVLFLQRNDGEAEALVTIVDAIFLQWPCAPSVLAAYTHVLTIEEEIGVF